jgi:hypothetical protein
MATTAAAASAGAAAVQVCGQGPATTPEKLEAALFEGEAASQAETLQGMFRSCSYGNADFSRSVGTEIVSAVVPIDCTGKTPWGAPFDSLTCPYTGEAVLAVLGCHSGCLLHAVGDWTLWHPFRLTASARS